MKTSGFQTFLFDPESRLEEFFRVNKYEFYLALPNFDFLGSKRIKTSFPVSTDS